MILERNAPGGEAVPRYRDGRTNDARRSAARVGKRDDRLDRFRIHLALELYGLPFSNVKIPILLFISIHI